MFFAIISLCREKVAHLDSLDLLVFLEQLYVSEYIVFNERYCSQLMPHFLVICTIIG